MKAGLKNSFSTLTKLPFDGVGLSYHSLPALAKKTGRDLRKLPRSLRVLLENLLRQEDGDIVKAEDISAFLEWKPTETSTHEIQFMPARVLLQDFTGVPVLADLAAMRAAMIAQGGVPERINPLQPVDLVIDHSVQVDAFGSPQAFEINGRHDFERNQERYEFLKWGQQAFSNFQVVPPETGICHQVNLEYLSHVAMRTKQYDGVEWVHPDTLVGTDSHTPMVNGLGVLGWGVGGIEAEAAMLGQPCSMLIPDVVGLALSGHLRPGVTATDLVLTITQLLRKHGVVGKFVEFTGPGVAALAIADRATISNMAPEYGATVGFWPVDRKTVEYLALTGRAERAKLTELYYRAQGLWLEPDGADGADEPEFSSLLHLDLGSVEPSMAGPAKPHDRSALSKVRESFTRFAGAEKKNEPHELSHGSVVIAAITSCTNTSNPTLMMGAAMLARNAAARGLKPKPWVKTSFAPGSTAVTQYLTSAGLMPSLEAVGFHLVGYGCTTCIGNSGPLPKEVADAVEKKDLVVAAVLSGNRNFEARIHPLVKANYLASPLLVVAFALAGRIDIDLENEPLGTDPAGKPVCLRDIWPNEAELSDLVSRHVNPHAFQTSYARVFEGSRQWKETPVKGGASYAWNASSSYIQRPPFLDPGLTEAARISELKDARLLALLGDFITTDHISPAGSIGVKTPAGQYLIAQGIKQDEFNSYGARRGNHEVMVRGTFANIRLKNHIASREGGYTRLWPSGQEMPIYEASLKYQESGTPLVIVAGREYGTGSSRDWAAKGTRLLGVRAVLAESFERIHRSNLVGMGVLPLEFTTPGDSQTFTGDEIITIEGLDKIKPKSLLKVRVEKPGGAQRTIEVVTRIDTPNELRYYECGGILPYVLKRLK
jgi:aconitate hydratase